MKNLRCCLTLAAVLGAGTCAAADADRLLGLINTYRNAPQQCEGGRSPPAGPLAPDARLDSLKPESGRRLQDILKARGYPAARAYTITVTGPRDASAAMSLIKQRYCKALLDPRYSQVGISREGETWRVALAQPLLSPNLGDWRAAGGQVLRLTNAARAQPRTCGNTQFPAAPALRWASELGAAALAHSRDMAARNYFAHRAPGGSEADARAKREGYDWRRVGENIAAGQGSPEQVMAAWLASPPHCENIMNPAFLEMGAAYAVNARSEGVVYWTQVFGRR